MPVFVDTDSEFFLEYLYARFARRYGMAGRRETEDEYKAALDSMPFYREASDSLLKYKDDRRALYSEMKNLGGYERDDVCPFTVMAWLYRSRGPRLPDVEKLAMFLGLKEKIPAKGIDMVHPDYRGSYFFQTTDRRGDRDVERLWNAFDHALKYADRGDESDREKFNQSFADAYKLRGVANKLTIVLFWCRPDKFLPLDGNTKRSLRERGISVPDQLDGDGYLAITENANNTLSSEGEPHPFFRLVRSAYFDGSQDGGAVEGEHGAAAQTRAAGGGPYSVEGIIKDGCFVDESELNEIMEVWGGKKNLILQGPPGTGKTYLARKLAHALVGSKNAGNVEAVQFHPGFSYEDFVRGWRPVGGGGLELADGPLLKLVSEAKKRPDEKFAMVIEEINRGNTVGLFGEMLTLLEADKRSEGEALTLNYARNDGERVHVPENVYVIGTMNTADRTAARMDLALRRRFAFRYIEPAFNDEWKKWCKGRGLDDGVLDSVKKNFVDLNKEIEKDEQLGRHFMVGHSYVTPRKEESVDEPQKWIERAVEYEVGPLLDEYWIGNPEKAKRRKEGLTRLGG